MRTEELANGQVQAADLAPGVATGGETDVGGFNLIEVDQAFTFAIP